MQIVYLKKLLDFSKKHADVRKSLQGWKMVTENANWKNRNDVLNTFPKAKMVRNDRARFEILHNTYRLIAHIDYRDQIVQIRFIGTHNEFDNVNPETI